jgi:hypothetical protein
MAKCIYMLKSKGIHSMYKSAPVVAHSAQLHLFNFK